MFCVTINKFYKVTNIMNLSAELFSLKMNIKYEKFTEALIKPTAAL